MYFLWQTSDILYYEVLDIPLPELQGLKTLKVAFHHATKDEVGFIPQLLLCCFNMHNLRNYFKQNFVLFTMFTFVKTLIYHFRLQFIALDYQKNLLLLM